MRRALSDLQGTRFDVVVVGGGIFGAFAAWDAAQRGLSVALVERSDFGAATSANSYKIVHGGIRYIQHGDVYRVRKSSADRRSFLRIAPHLVQPLPIVVPTYGRGMKGRLALRTGMGIYDALTPDRNRGIHDPDRRIPSGHTLDRAETLRLFPGLDPKGLTGAGVFSDGQMYNPPRLVLAVVKSAVACGAVVANYVEATGLIREGSRVTGVVARDVATGADFDISARTVLNAAGPYAEHLLRRAMDLPLDPPGTYSRDACFVVPRPWIHPTHALAVQARTSDPDAILSRGERHIFIAPWHQYSLIGTWHKVHSGDPNHLTVTDRELESFVAEANAGYAELNIRVEDVSVVNFGLVPFGQNQDGSGNLRYGHRSRLVDHGKDHGIDNLVSLIGVRFTTGRSDAERAVDLIFRMLGTRSSSSRTAGTPVVGGNIGNWSEFLSGLEDRYVTRFESQTISALGHNYGSETDMLLASCKDHPDLAHPIGSSDTVEAQVRYAVRDEMAMTLADIVFRRTDLATGTHPGSAALDRCQEILGEELELSARRLAEQRDEVESRLPTRGTLGSRA